MSTTISKLEVELTLDSKNFEARVRGSKEALKAFTGVIGKADTKVKRHAKNVRNLGTSFRHTVVTLGLMRDAIRTAWRASGGLVQGIVDVTAEFERLNVLLTGMSKGVTAIEKATDAAEQFNKVIALAKNAPFAVKELTNSWVKFKSVGIDPATGSLNALVDAVSAFGGTGDILHRATIAVQQMAGKGVISMEELRQQMGEAVPQAMVLLARGMNLSVGDMVDAISKGSVIAKPALAKLFAEFDLTFGGASQKLMETYIGSLARLNTVWQLTLKEMGEASGLFEAVKEEVKLLIVQLDDPAVRRFGIDIARGMVNAFRMLIKVLRETVTWLSKHADMVMKVVFAWGAFRAMGIVKMLFVTNKALKTLATTASILASLGFAKMTGNALKAGVAMKGLASVSGLVGKAFKAMKLPGLVGIILSVAAAMWGWWRATKAVNDEHRSGLQDVRDYGEAATKESIELAKKEIEVSQKRETFLINLVKKREKEIAQAQAEGNVRAEGLAKRRLALAKSSLVETQRLVQEAETLISDAVEGASRRASDNARREAMTAFRKGLEEKTNAARDEDAKIDILFNKGVIDEKERLALRLKNWAKFQEDQTAFALAQQQLQVIEIMKAETALGGNLSEQSKSDWRDRKTAAIVALREIALVAQSENLRIAADVSSIAAPTALLDAAKKLQAGYASSLGTILANGKAKLAGMNAEITDGMKELEAFQAKVDAGKFGLFAAFTPEMMANYKAALEMFKEIDRVSDELKAKKAFEGTMSQIAKTLGKATEQALIYSDAVKSGLNSVPDRSLQKIRLQFAGFLAQAEERKDTEAQINEIYAKRAMLLKIQQSTNADKRILETRKEINDLDVAAIVNLEKRFEKEQELFDQQWNLFLLENKQAENIEELTLLYEQLRAKREQAFENSTPLKRMLRDWEDTKGKLEQSYADWMDNFVTTFVDGIAEGKFAFKEFAKSILKDLLTIQLRAMIVQSVMAAIGGSTVNSGVNTSSLGGVSGADYNPFASQVIKYARGGIATKPQIAVHGEGSMNEAYVPLPDGRSIPVSMRGGGGGDVPDVTVNVINESGVPVDAEQNGGLEFDGEGYVLNVVLSAASRPGAFRDGLKSATG